MKMLDMEGIRAHNIVIVNLNIGENK